MTTPISPSALQRDEAYYITSGDVVFLVENILFRVHRHFFARESTHFQTLFETPPPQNQPAPGSSDSSALILDKVTSSQFARFVWVFYNPKFSLYDEATVDDWKSLLELSHIWHFPEVKQLAIRELQKKNMSPVERIELYHANAVDRNLLIDDYRLLCERPDPITLNEGIGLGLKTTLIIARTREEIRSPRSPAGVKSPLTPTIQGQELIDLIGKSFVTSDNDTTGSVILGQPNPRPTILINGVSGSNTEPKTATQESNDRSGGLAPKPQDKETKPLTPTQQAAPKVPPKNPTTENQATNPKSKKGRNDKNKPRNPSKDDPQAQTPVAGQQTADAGTSGGEPKGDAKGDITENKGDSSKGDEKAQSEGKSGTTEDAGRKTEEAGDAQAAKTNGNGDAQTSNGDDTKGDAEKNKTENMQRPTKRNSQQGTLAIDVSNNVTNGGDGNSGGQRGSSVPKSTTQIGSALLSNLFDRVTSM